MAVVHVPQGQAVEPIRALLKAAEELGLPASVVATSSDGLYGFSLVVPDLVYERAFGHPEELDFLRGATPKEPGDDEPVSEPIPVPKKKGGRPRKAAAEPVVEEEQE